MVLDLPCSLNDIAEVVDAAFSVWILEDDASNILAGEVGLVNVDHLDSNSKRSCSGFHTADGLWVKLV